VTERLECERCGTTDGTVAVRQLRTQTAALCDLCDAALHGRLMPQPSRVIILAFALAMAGFVVVSAVVIVLVD
jgi:uncharacterized paraquat-inducible protein A